VARWNFVAFTQVVKVLTADLDIHSPTLLIKIKIAPVVKVAPGNVRDAAIL